ncbi:MAG TPA: hypothetical protein DDW76_07200 [Cyanobacteria bacterium UBA11369]|nr:hypothetical protein [Cyanobacteria bacterium UBA11371]HBE31635.1 hypothetical protein [Cyanobacteria bacterium UBA11368]HBE48579.1 hypothetical protein [Cyanobacteria bacterium UBA11369]
MSSSPNDNSIFVRSFFILLGVTVAYWLLRGFGLRPFTSLPGGIIWVLMLLCIVTGILSYLQVTRW